MLRDVSGGPVGAGGVLIGPVAVADQGSSLASLNTLLEGTGLHGHVVRQDLPSAAGTAWRLNLSSNAAQLWAPGFDTLGLADQLDQSLGHEPDEARRLDREILAALLVSPVDQPFPSVGELASAVRMRRLIALAAARTAMDFHTSKVARPMHLWDYDEDRGFTLRAGADLIEALRVTTQPDVSGELYAFSCYRATEYIILLGMAEEMQTSHPALYDSLQAQWRESAIASGRFHDTFLHEFGSNEAPLPPRYYIPGDRVWFRNPDEASSDASGYEGSWTMVLGGGHFANMWKRNQPFTLRTKCVEIYHWRHATFRDAEGDMRIDESVVERCVAETLADPARTEAIVQRMLHCRDLKGTYAEGGCIDRTREGPRYVLPASTDIPLVLAETAPAPATGNATAPATEERARETL